MVSFELSDEQREIRDWVHSFAEKEIRPVAHEYDESEEFHVSSSATRPASCPRWSPRS
jgi:alkylation response protein AidB-like acyl-CoA dehydrogenase